MRFIEDRTPAEFLAHTARFRDADPILTNVLSTLAMARANGSSPVEPDARWIRVESTPGEVIGIALQTPPHGLLLSDMPHEVARFLAGQLVDARARFPEVNGPIDPVTAFAKRYTDLTYGTYEARLDQRMLVLRRLIPPRPVDGVCRTASTADRDTLVRWMTDFNTDIGHPYPADAAQIERRISAPGALWLWERDSRPRSLCWQSVAAAGIVRISAVYTPPDERGHGYASVNVASVSQRALDAGADACVLYTDRANPTSNKVYEAIGYEWVADCMLYRLTSDTFTPGGDWPDSAPVP